MPYPCFRFSFFFGICSDSLRSEVGFVWGKSHALRSYGFAVLYPILVMGAIAAIAALTGALNTAGATPHKHSVWLNLLLVGGTTIPVALLTEEGFFRGWLWASLKRTGQGIDCNPDS